MDDCIFCKIASGEIPCNKVYEDDQVLCFHDLSPQAPVHVLIIPKTHYDSVLQLEEQDAALVGHIMVTINNVAKQLGISESGFRLITNVGKDGGQTVKHMHFHLLGGRAFSNCPG